MYCIDYTLTIYAWHLLASVLYHTVHRRLEIMQVLITSVILQSAWYHPVNPVHNLL